MCVLVITGHDQITRKFWGENDIGPHYCQNGLLSRWVPAQHIRWPWLCRLGYFGLGWLYRSLVTNGRTSQPKESYDLGLRGGSPRKWHEISSAWRHVNRPKLEPLSTCTVLTEINQNNVGYKVKAVAVPPTGQALSSHYSMTTVWDSLQNGRDQKNGPKCLLLPHTFSLLGGPNEPFPIDQTKT